MKVLHHPTCSKSNALIDFLTAHKFEFEVIDLTKTSLNKSFLIELQSSLNLPFSEMIRRNERIYEEKFFHHQNDVDWLDVLLEYPILLQRPIVIYKGKAILARPVEKVFELVRDEK